MEPSQIEELATQLANKLSQASAAAAPARNGMEARDQDRERSMFSRPLPLPTRERLAHFIDHTQLKPDAPREAIEQLCAEAREHNFWSVCVNASNVRLASTLLRGARTQVCAVVGFPLGASTPSSKAFEAREAARYGASEIDMVLNIGALRSLDYHLVSQDIAAVVEAVPGKIVKVILETSLLDEREKIIACALAKGAGAHFVKTSTGFNGGGATLDDVRLMREVVGQDMGVKASGGIRDAKKALAMLEAGANRLGCSSSVAIVGGKTLEASGSDQDY